MENSLKVTVYGKDNCPACRQTKMFLKRNHIAYEDVVLADKDGNLYRKEDQPIVDEFIEAGYQQYPVVSVMGNDITDSWSGFNPSELNLLKQAYTKTISKKAM